MIILMIVFPLFLRRINFAFNFHVYFARRKLLHYFPLSLSLTFSLPLPLSFSLLLAAPGCVFSARRTFRTRQIISNKCRGIWRRITKSKVDTAWRPKVGNTLWEHIRGALIAASCQLLLLLLLLPPAAEKLRKTVEELLQNAIRKSRARKRISLAVPQGHARIMLMPYAASVYFAPQNVLTISIYSPMPRPLLCLPSSLSFS